VWRRQAGVRWSARIVLRFYAIGGQADTEKGNGIPASEKDAAPYCSAPAHLGAYGGSTAAPMLQRLY